MKRKQPERQLQAAVATYLRAALPPDAFFSALPGGDRQMTRAPGYRAGLPDLMVVWNAKPIFIELKSKRGTISDDQAIAINALWRAGAEAAVCRSIDEVASVLKFSGIPLLARVAA